MDTLDTLDNAFARLHLTDVEYASGSTDGLSNHGPMAVESLLELGGEARIEPFLARYERRLRPLPLPDDRAPTLGDPTSARAFVDHYRAVFMRGDWRRPLARVLDELLPAAVSGAAHGWLRTAHAIRALTAHDTPVRRAELAFGLASWGARFQALPGSPGLRPRRGLDVTSALAEVPLLPLEARREASLIVDRVDQIAEVVGFVAAIESVDFDAAPLEDSISALAQAAARLFLATPSQRFIYLHAITATSALRLVWPVLGGDARRQAFAAVFHAVAALHATHGEPTSRHVIGEGSWPLREHGAPSAEAVRAAAIASDDDHDIKLAAAVLRENAIAPAPELLAAAGVRLGL